MKLDTFEFQLFKKLKVRPQQSYLLGISGGLDSMVLLHAFWRVSQKIPLQILAAYVHHGKTGTKRQISYRDKAQALVKKTCQLYKIPLNLSSANEDGTPMEMSEAGLREFRYNFFRRQGFDTLVTAHHRDDLLETRIIRLIRGTGPQGLRSMRESDPGIYRPLLSFSKVELKSYARKWKLKWLDDPSNQDEKVLRNWLRHSWLPELEKKRAGGVDAMARSLELLSNFCDDGDNDRQDGALVEASGGYLDRVQLASLDVAKKQQSIANFLRAQKVTNYSLNQINEVIKRLNTRRKHFAFVVARVKWQVSDKQLTLA